MKPRIELVNTTPAWHSIGGEGEGKTPGARIHTRGQAWIGDRYYEGEALSRWVSKKLSEIGQDHARAFNGWIQSLNGHFAVVVQTAAYVLAAVDNLRSLPLFYALNESGLVLSDSAEYVLGIIGGSHFDDLAVKEFLLAGYVTGKDTLFPSLKQLQAGEYLCWDRRHPRRANTVKYFRFRLADTFEGAEEEFLKVMLEVYGRGFGRFLSGVGGRRIVVPLSGGYDSRSIVAMLKMLGANNVLCYSYGKQGDWEGEVSRKVAGKLGYAWHFERLSPRLWRKCFLEWEDRNAYLRFGSGATSIAILQDWIVIKLMKEKGVLQPGDLIVPGHAGDFLAGSKLPNRMDPNDSWNARRTTEWIFRQHYALWPSGPDGGLLRSKILERIKTQMGVDGMLSTLEAATAIENWCMHERLGKFIINSVRAYESLGFEWRTPIWDNDIVGTWTRAPVPWRAGRRFYRRFASAKLFSPLGVDGDSSSGRRRTSRGIELARHAYESLIHPSTGRYSFKDVIQAMRVHRHHFHTSFMANRHLLRFNNLTASMVLEAWMGWASDELGH